MSVKIFHDDVRPCPFGWELARDNRTCLGLVRKADRVEKLSLDHDLGASPEAGVWAMGCSPEGDGKDLVKSLIAENLLEKIEEIRIHSWNPGGAEAMLSLLKEAEHPNCYREMYVADGLNPSVWDCDMCADGIALFYGTVCDYCGRAWEGEDDEEQ